MNDELLHFVADEGLRLGLDDLRVALTEREADTIVVRDGKIDRLQRAASRTLMVDMYLDGRYGYVSTSRLDRDAIRALLLQGVATTRLLQPDPAQRLPDPERYYKGPERDMQTYDEHLCDVTPEEKRPTAPWGGGGTLELRYSDFATRFSLLATNGFVGHRRNTRVSLTAIATVEGEGGQRPMDAWGETRLRFADLPRTGIAETALARARRKIGARPAPSGRYTLIVEAPVVGTLLAPLLDALQGAALQQRMSFLADKMGETVGSPLLHLVDDPLTPGQRGATLFDMDGVATRRRVIFDHGRLRTFFIDTPYSIRLRLPPTTLDTHHTVFAPGTRSLPELIAQTQRGLFVTDFNGGNCDPSTGHFSFGIEGHLIEHGALTRPVSGMNITGSMLTLWHHLADVANDADPYEVDLIPSLLFDDVSAGGQ